jgi:DNA-binding MarR family transcriptional regulator
MTNRVGFDHISSYSAPEESPGFLLWRTSTLWRRSLEVALKPYDLTHPQFVVLATVGWLTKEGQKTSQIAVSRLSGLDPNTVSQILRGLQAKGILVRSAPQGGKRKTPLLTPEGVDRLSHALPAVEQADAEFFSSLKREKQDFLKGLRKLAYIDRGEL